MQVQVKVLESRFGRCTLTFTKTADGVTTVRCSKDRHTVLRVSYMPSKKGWIAEFQQPGLTETFYPFVTDRSAYQFLVDRFWKPIK